jgi:tetratricopeptide (TPR) repeat protein
MLEPTKCHRPSPPPRGAAVAARRAPRWQRWARALALALGLALGSAPALAAAQAHPALDQARALIEDERYGDAFDKLAALIPTLTVGDPVRDAAQFELARVLLAERLYQSALRALDEIAVGPESPLYVRKARAYLQIQRALPGDLATIERLGQAPESAFKAEDLPEIRFLLGRSHFDAGDHERALEVLSRINPRGGEFYLKARYLMGVTYVILNQAKPALEAFKDILRYEKTIGSPAYYPAYRERAFMTLGRLFYSMGNYETAGRYYDQVREGSSVWLDSLFELGWTYFHLKRLDRVLGQLHTLNSPYFEDRYYPEARVLEALILFRTCRFNEVLVVVARFLRDYRPLRKELDQQLAGNRSDAEFYWYLASLAGDRESLSVSLRRIFNAALNDKELQRMFTLVAKLGAEQAGLARLERNVRAKAFAKALADDLGRVRNVMISEAGAMARQRLALVREELTEIIRQGLRIKYEALRARRNSINEEVRVAMGETANAANEPREEDEEHVVWPFDGAYWRDELGAYTYDIESRCEQKHFPPGFKVARRKARAGAGKPAAAGSGKPELDAGEPKGAGAKPAAGGAGGQR